MGKILNRLSFYLSLICGALVIVFSTNLFKNQILKWFGIHPLEFLFYFTLVVLAFGVIGFSGVFDWKGVIRSIFTVGFSLVLTIFLAYIIFVGNIMN